MNLAIIIGAMKSGTTTLFQYLSIHPQIASCRRKEPHYFCHERRWELGEEWYRGLFDWDPDRHQWALEASTGYTKAPTVRCPADRIHAFPGEKRLFYIIREPIAQIESHMTYGRIKKWPSYMGEEVPGKAVDIVRYATQLRPYVDLFGRDRILLLLFEELVADPEAVVRRALRHLDLDAGGIDIAGRGAFNVTEELRTRPGWYNAIRGTSWAQWTKRLLPHRSSLLQLLPGFEKVPRFRLSPTKQRRLLVELGPELEALQKDLDVDLSPWRLSGGTS